MNDFAESMLGEIVKRVNEAVSPKEVFLFGSRAWGTPTAGSDVDLLVVISNGEGRAHTAKQKIRQRLQDIMVPIDLIVESADLFERRKRVAASLENRISHCGKKL